MRRLEVAAANGTRFARMTTVLVRVPADRDYIVVVRAAVGQLCGRLGYTLTEVTDLRLAVDEACGLLIDAPGPAGELECVMAVEPAAVHVTVTGPVRRSQAPDTDGFGWTILAALVDSIRWWSDGSTAVIDVRKGRDPRPPG